MKKITLILLVFTAMASAQDLIVTKNNDSIKATITKTDKETIYFRYIKNGKAENSLLDRSDVLTLKEGYYGNDQIPKADKIKKMNKSYDGERLRIALNAGLGYRTAKIINVEDKVVKDYLRKLKKGLDWDADVHYFITESLALGARFNSFHSSNSENNILTTFPDGNQEQGISNDIVITYIGPSLVSRLMTANEKNAFTTSLSLGYMGLRNEEKNGNRTFTSRGSTLGMNVDIGYEFGLSENFALAVKAAGSIGVINEVKVEEQGMPARTVNLKDEFGEGEGLHRISIMAGVRFYL